MLREFYLPQIAAYWKAVTEMTESDVQRRNLFDRDRKVHCYMIAISSRGNGSECAIYRQEFGLVAPFESL